MPALALILVPHYDLVPYAAAAFAAADLDVHGSDGLPASVVYARSAGTLALVTGAGYERAFTVADGWVRNLQVRTIKQTTTVDLEVGY